MSPVCTAPAVFVVVWLGKSQFSSVPPWSQSVVIYGAGGLLFQYVSVFVIANKK